VKLLERSIREMEAWLEREPERIARKETLAPNKLAEALSLSVQELTLSQARLRAELAQKEAQIRELSQRRDRLLALEAERAEVSRRLTTEQENYRVYAAALQQASLDEALDRERISNVVVMQAASYNPARSFPKTLPILAATPFLALAAMLLTVWLAALLDRKARSGELVQRQADVPLLADIPLPQPGTWRRSSKGSPASPRRAASRCARRAAPRPCPPPGKWCWWSCRPSRASPPTVWWTGTTWTRWSSWCRRNGRRCRWSATPCTSCGVPAATRSRAWSSTAGVW